MPEKKEGTWEHGERGRRHFKRTGEVIGQVGVKTSRARRTCDPGKQREEFTHSIKSIISVHTNLHNQLHANTVLYCSCMINFLLTINKFTSVGSNINPLPQRGASKRQVRVDLHERIAVTGSGH